MTLNRLFIAIFHPNCFQKPNFPKPNFVSFSITHIRPPPPPRSPISRTARRTNPSQLDTNSRMDKNKFKNQTLNSIKLCTTKLRPVKATAGRPVAALFGEPRGRKVKKKQNYRHI